MYRDDFTQNTNGFGVQGDVPIVRRDALPAGCKPVKGNILRDGEVTGHHHIVDASVEKFQLYTSPTGELWMELFADVAIRHQEHGTLIMPPGVYVIPEQVEYDGAEERRVLD